jgi:hypothetical protein
VPERDGHQRAPTGPGRQAGALARDARLRLPQAAGGSTCCPCPLSFVSFLSPSLRFVRLSFPHPSCTSFVLIFLSILPPSLFLFFLWLLFLPYCFISRFLLRFRSPRPNLLGAPSLSLPFRMLCCYCSLDWQFLPICRLPQISDGHVGLTFRVFSVLALCRKDAVSDQLAQDVRCPSAQSPNASELQDQSCC